MTKFDLRVQRRLAAGVLKCGKNRVFMDPSRSGLINVAGSRGAIRSIIRKGGIVKKAVKGQSRYRCRLYQEAKRKGRHLGAGKRRGTANARCPTKKAWIARIRTLRRLLKKFRARKVLDSHAYHTFYLRAKGNQFKNKKVLIEAVYDARNQIAQDRLLNEQRDARIAKAAARKQKQSDRVTAASGAAEQAPTTQE